MLSLPMIPPRADASLWPSHRNNNNYYTEEASTSPPNTSSQRHPHAHPGQHHNHGRSNYQSALLAALTQDENTIEQRKLNVRRFGAGWIRPPGINKTLQATDDEKLEKEEQEMMQRREQVMMDLAAAQQDAANAEARAQGEEEEGQDQTEERDLDDEVPEAEGSASEVSASDSSDEEGSVTDEGGENDTTVPFNEDSFIEGSMLEAEVSHMLEMEEAEMAGVLQDERDLDDDVPEAGSYEHTDSELEDESEEEASRAPGMTSVQSRRSRRSSGRRTSGRRSSGLPSGFTAHGGASSNFTASRGMDLGVDLGHGRSSFGLDGSSSIMEGSSFLRSSPAAAVARGSLRDRLFGAVRGGRRG
ncbi:hypothetical protein CC86DRAFT_455902 [Ophiobolus disseminans]|uniref:Uncharacterized protein n=1 Tax=Ophiobolus disseminans TaxID=1469910 RepID=A0A6A7A0I2_9PLEO|nr:hypothetical protein CC86DRAFT_455902 [Ophiobolus disseminans]